MLVALLLPLLGQTTPAIRLPMLETFTPPVRPPVEPRAVPTPDAPGLDGRSLIDRPAPAGLGPVDLAPLAERVLFGVWLAGAVAGLSAIGLSGIRLRGLVRRARPVNDAAMLRVRDRLAIGMGSMPPVLVSREVGTPAAVGLMRPVILVPAGRTWGAAELEAVLTHELAHVRRRDGWIDLAARAMRAVYWCNPLAWVAVRRLTLERERACDDRVLGNGADPEAYAFLLLAAAREASRARILPAGAAAMTRPGELESRLLAVLDPDNRRDPPARPVPVYCIAAALLLGAPLSALRVQAAASQPNLLLPEPDRQRDSLADPTSERVRITAAAELDPERLLAGPDAALARRLLEARERLPEGEYDLVAERATWALHQARDGRLVEPLLDKLGAADWRVAAYAAWALALVPDARMVPPLIPLVSHPVWRLRAMAAHGLAAAADPRARPAMMAALRDPAWQVRVQAVHYFHAVDGAGARAMLEPLRQDRHLAVRAAVEQILP